MSIRVKLVLFISLLFITAVGNALFTFQLEKYGEEKLEWVIHTNNVILETKELLSNIKDTETGQRGYLLTEDTSYLEPYHAGIIAAVVHFDNLVKLTSDNPLQKKRLNEIKKFMYFKFDELKETIRLKEKQNGERNKALELVKQNKGKHYMDNIRTLLKEFNNTEMILLEQRKGDFRADRARITTVMTIEVMFLIFLALMTITFLNKNLFHPLKLLLLCTHKMEAGEKVDVSDITSKDEMGYLLSSFFVMQEKVYTRTENLDYKAHHDELTGLKNRVKMHHEIEESIEELKKFKIKFAVMFIDLNKFKQLNDTLGHDAGDVMLKETANRLRESIHPDNTVFRLGGDEFLVLIKNAKNDSEVQNIVSTILEDIKPPVMIQGQPIAISLSIGIAISPDDTENSDEVLKYSDIAMYEAKRDETCDYKFFDKSMLKRSSDFVNKG